MDGAVKILAYVCVGGLIVSIAIMLVQLGIFLWNVGPLALLGLLALPVFYAIGGFSISVMGADFGD